MRLKRGFHPTQCMQPTYVTQKTQQTQLTERTQRSLLSVRFGRYVSCVCCVLLLRLLRSLRTFYRSLRTLRALRWMETTLKPVILAPIRLFSSRSSVTHHSRKRTVSTSLTSNTISENYNLDYSILVRYDKR